MNRYYITCAIPYVNAPPHIGHALEFVQTDTIARFKLLQNYNVCFLTGSDENSLKNVQAAQLQDISPQKLCQQNTQKFKKLLKSLNTTVNIFQRGTDKSHIVGSQKLWLRCQKAGDIYKKKYKGLYCVGCEAFYTKDELTKDGLCPEHLKKPEKVEEVNYFFKLAKYQKFLEDLIEKDKLKITPQIRKNEVLAFIKKGLRDFSVSRPAKRAHNWGIPVPHDPSQIIYVWFDALNIYQTGIGFGTNSTSYQKWWPANLHIIGKGISRFHAIFWPAILKSAGLKLPSQIFIHGYITCQGQKISKSLGNIVDPNNLIKKYRSDPVRYYLLREIPPYQDGDFSNQRFRQLYNSDLANGLGNLVARVARLCQNSGYKFPDKKTDYQIDKKVANFLSQYKFNQALASLWQDNQKSITSLDKLINNTQPWNLKGAKLKKVLNTSVSTIRYIAYNLQPFLPQTAQIIIDQFAGPKIISRSPLFPRLS